MVFCSVELRGKIWDLGGITHTKPYHGMILIWDGRGIPSQLKDMGWDLPLGYALSLFRLAHTQNS